MKKTFTWTVLLCGLVTVPAMAQETAKPVTPAVAPASGANGSPSGSTPEQGEAAPAKRWTVATGFDFATAYLFRGIFQEDQGTIVPPYVDVGVTVYQGSGALKSVTLNGGNWNSLHSGPTGGGQGNAWYEADYYGSVTMAVGNWKPGALFTSYTSPNDVFKTVHELAGVVAYDDSSRAFPVSPRAMVAFELSGQADGGAKKGVYLELGIRPSVPLIRGKAPLSLAFPVKAGFSLKDYYESPDGNSTLGYVDTGVIASVALPVGKTTWDIHGGVDFMWLGDSNTRLNGGDRSKPVGIIGIGISY